MWWETGWVIAGVWGKKQVRMEDVIDVSTLLQRWRGEGIRITLVVVEWRRWGFNRLGNWNDDDGIGVLIGSFILRYLILTFNYRWTRCNKGASSFYISHLISFSARDFHRSLFGVYDHLHSPRLYLPQSPGPAQVHRSKYRNYNSKNRIQAEVRKVATAKQFSNPML